MTHDARPTTSRLGLALPETPLAEPGKQRPVVVKSPARRMPVSYTHLTLPTILRV